MDLLTLPEEMLASVLKYSNVPNLTKYRQINSQVDRITLRNRLNEPRLKKLSFTIRDKTIEVRAVTISGFECTKQFQFTEKDRGETIYEVVQNTYLKVRYTKLFEINNCRKQRMELSNRVINMLIDNSKKRQISGLSLFNLVLDMDFTLMRQLLTSFDIEHFSLSYCKSSNLGQVCSEDVVNRSKKNVNLSLYGLSSGGLHADAIEDILEPLDTHGMIKFHREQLYIRSRDHHIIIFLRF